MPLQLAAAVAAYLAAENAHDLEALATCDFPGSPIDLRFVFALDGERIASLEVRP